MKQSGHIGGGFSMIELTSVLYEDYDIGGKDKLILSKGHMVPIIYNCVTRNWSDIR